MLLTITIALAFPVVFWSFLVITIAQSVYAILFQSWTVEPVGITELPFYQELD
jgi:hypothetical protein